MDIRKILSALPPEKKDELRAKALKYMRQTEKRLTPKEINRIGKQQLIKRIICQVLKESGYLMNIKNFKFTVSEDEITLNFNDGQTRTYKFDKVTPKVAKTIWITSGVTVDGDFLFFGNERINISDIDAIYDSAFSTYLLTGNERKYITSTLNDIDGEMAKRIAKYCPHLTEFNDNVFIAKNKITGFLVDVKPNSKRTKNDFAGFNIGAVVGNSFVPVSCEKDFDNATIKRAELCATYCVN